jgi:hypothetical protein
MAKYRSKRGVVEATQWFKNGDHPNDESVMLRPDPKGVTQFEPFLSEGKVVRRFAIPGINAGAACFQCGRSMHDHGWIDTSDGGYTVCPGDWIVTIAQGSYRPCKPVLFDAIFCLAKKKKARAKP